MPALAQVCLATRVASEKMRRSQESSEGFAGISHQEGGRPGLLARIGSCRPGADSEPARQVKPMRCRKARELTSLYLAPGDSWLSPKDRQALVTHMAACEPCCRDCRESRKALATWRDCSQVSADTATTLEKVRRQERHEGSARIIRLFDTSPRMAAWAAATCLATGVLDCWVFLHRPSSLPAKGRSVALTRWNLSLLIESTDGGHVVPGAVIQTSAGESRSLVLTSRHRVVMHTGTGLSMAPLGKAGKTGSLVNLALGGVRAQVEHGGDGCGGRTGRKGNGH
jgi:hypothetical protein